MSAPPLIRRSDAAEPTRLPHRILIARGIVTGSFFGADRNRVALASAGIAIVACALLAVTLHRAGNTQRVPTRLGAKSDGLSVAFSVRAVDERTAQVRRDAVAGLLMAPSPIAAEAVLAAHGWANGAVERLGGGMNWGAIDTNNPSSGVMATVTRVEHRRGALVIVPVRLSLPASAAVRNSGWTSVSADGLFAFDEGGNMLAQIGGGVSDDGINGDSLNVLSLGTSGHWFAIVSRYERGHPFELLSEVYLLEPGLPRALRVHHYLNDLAFTLTRDEARNHGSSGIAFCGKSHCISPGTKLTNGGGDNWIRWDDRETVFFGSPKGVHEGYPLYEVDVNESRFFRASNG